MGEIKLKISDLVLDHDNPRISHAAGQQEALQKIVQDQKTKLVKLAQSIVDHGLNPMDNFLVLRTNQAPLRYIALEGNRRTAVFKLLTNPDVMSGLDMPEPMKRIFERMAKGFKKNSIEPLRCFELPSREAGRYWLDLRHNGGHDGAGIDNWKSLAKRRFQGKPPSVQVLDLVTERAGLTAAERASITDKFPTSTLERLIDSPAVRKELGIDLKDGEITTKLSAAEIAKPLKKIVLDLANKTIQVGQLMKTEQMLSYIKTGLGKESTPDKSKSRATARTLEEIPTSEFPKVKITTRRKPDPSDRKEVVPKSCKLNVTDNRLADIYKELRTLKLSDALNAIAVLLRVFLELSLDHFLEKNGHSLKFTPPSGTREIWKELDKKLAEVVVILVSIGVPQKHFDSVTRSINQKSSPMNIQLLHNYVHDKFATPLPKELAAAWNHAQPLFEKIWP